MRQPRCMLRRRKLQAHLATRRDASDFNRLNIQCRFV